MGKRDKTGVAWRAVSALSAIVLLMGVASFLFPSPVLAATDEFNASGTANGYAYDYGSSYVTAWASTTAYQEAPNGTPARVGQWWNGGEYFIHRGYVSFDTSSLPDDAVITSATLKIYGYLDNSTTDFYITIQNGQPTYPHAPLQAGDYNRSYYSGDGGSLTTVGFDIYGYNEIELNDDGISWISLTGTTKFCLRSSRDILGIAPSGAEYIQFVGATSPVLEVTYTVASAPSITANEASSVAQTTARLNSTVVDDGGETCEVRFGYGTTQQDAVDFGDYDTVTDWVDGYETGNYPYYDASSLVADTPYYYRVQIKNTHSTVTSTAEITFTTGSSIGNASNFYGLSGSTDIILSFTRGSGASQVMVRFRLDTFPTSTSDGTLVYLGALGSYNHTGLTAGTTYYYAAWGESGGDYSDSPAEVAVTTLGASPVGAVEGETPSLPSSFFQEPSYSGFTGIEPVPTIIDIFATSWGMPLNNMWFILTMLGIVGGVMFILLRFRSLLGASIFAFMALIVGIMVHLIPSWMLLVPAVVALGAWAVWRLKPVA